jgi:hypothetical protein
MLRAPVNGKIRHIEIPVRTAGKNDTLIRYDILEGLRRLDDAARDSWCPFIHRFFIGEICGSLVQAHRRP